MLSSPQTYAQLAHTLSQNLPQPACADSDFFWCCQCLAKFRAIGHLADNIIDVQTHVASSHLDGTMFRLTNFTMRAF